MSVAIDTISQMDLFKNLKTAELAKIAAAMKKVRVSEGETLTNRGDTANNFYIVLSGMFMITYQKERALTLNQSGDLIGWSTVVDPYRYTGTTTALTAGEVLVIAGNDLLALMEANPDVRTKVMAKIATSSLPRKSLDISD